MLFSPRNEKMWDTWLVEREGLYYLFYIRIGPNAGRVGPKPMLGAGWDGISLATSTDLLHWQEQGPVIEKHDEAAWLGTGMIHRAGDKYILNFSEERPRGQQVVVFAESDDLKTWSRLPGSSDLRPDGVIYQRDPAMSADPLPRWGLARHYSARRLQIGISRDYLRQLDPDTSRIMRDARTA